MSIPDRIELTCKAISKLRANGRCQLGCGRPLMESHNLFFGQWTSYWQLQVNHYFYIAFCHRCHQVEPFAPHVSLKMFWPKLEVSLRQAGQVEHWRIIKTQHTALYNGSFSQKARSDPKPDFKEIHSELRKGFTGLDQTNWMDMDCQEVINIC